MSRDPDLIDSADTLFARLRARCEDDWAAYCEHAFVQGLGDGSLPEAAFRHYLIQDYRFLVHFSRAWALSVYKSDRLDEMRAASRVLSAILDHEMGLHVQYCARWGIGLEEMERAPEARANMAYTRYVLERGVAGDVLDLQVALAPCTIGYAVIGRRLAALPGALDAANPYRDWVEMYSGEAYLESVRETVRLVDRLAERRLTPARFEDLVETFRQATRLEIAFWDMGLGCES